MCNHPVCGPDPGWTAAISEIYDRFRQLEGFADLIELIADDNDSQVLKCRVYLVAECIRELSQKGMAQAIAIDARV